MIKAKAYVKEGEDDEAIDYFNVILPRIRAAHGGDARLGTIEFVQRPGEVRLVSSCRGWRQNPRDPPLLSTFAFLLFCPSSSSFRVLVGRRCSCRAAGGTQ